VIGYDRSEDAVRGLELQGAVGARSLQEFVSRFEERPRVTWVMVPAGDPTSQTIKQLVDLVERGDIVIDGGNTNWKDALADAENVKAGGLRYLDAGTSGGIWGWRTATRQQELLARNGRWRQRDF